MLTDRSFVWYAEEFVVRLACAIANVLPLVSLVTSMGLFDLTIAYDWFKALAAFYQRRCYEVSY